MARAHDLKFDEADQGIARAYAMKTMPAALGVTLEDKGDHLLNTKSNATYSVWLSPGHAHNSVVIGMWDDGTILFGNQCMWIAVIDAATSELHLIPQVNFVAAMKQAVSNGGQYQGLKVDSRPVEGYQKEMCYVEMNIGWGEANKLILKTVKLGKKETFLHFRGMKLVSKEKMVHLHAHSYYSLLDGVSSPEDLVDHALLNGQPGLALTDHGNMMGSFKLWKACKEIDFKVKPLLGCEVYLVDDAKQRYKDPTGNVRRFTYHQTLIAMNQEGWANLCELLSIASRDNFYYEPLLDHKTLFEHADGIICLSGCFKGMVSHHLQHHDPVVTADMPWYCYNPDHAKKVMQAYKDRFQDRYFAEVHNNNFARYMDSVPRVMQMANDVGVPIVVANDAHFADPQDAILQALFSKINSDRTDEIATNAEQAAPYYIKSRAELEGGIYTADMFDRTCEIMERCDVSFAFQGYLFPKYDMAADVDWTGYQSQVGKG